MILPEELNRQITADSLKEALTNNMSRLKMNSFQLFDKLNFVEDSFDDFTHSFKQNPTDGFLDVLGFTGAVDSQSWQFDDFAQDIEYSFSQMPKKCQEAMGSKLSQYASNGKGAVNDVMNQFQFGGIQNQLGGIGKNLIDYKKLIDSTGISGIMGTLDNLLNCSLDFSDLLGLDFLSDMMDHLTNLQLDLFLDDLFNLDIAGLIENGLNQLTGFLENAIDNIAGMVQGFFDSVIGNIQAMIQKAIGEVLGQIRAVVDKVFAIVDKVIATAEKIIDMFFRIKTGAQKLIEKWY